MVFGSIFGGFRKGSGSVWGGVCRPGRVFGASSWLLCFWFILAEALGASQGDSEFRECLGEDFMSFGRDLDGFGDGFWHLDMQKAIGTQSEVADPYEIEPCMSLACPN